MSAAAPAKAQVAPKKKEKKGAKRQPQINVPGGSSIAETQDERAFQKQPGIFTALRTAPVAGLKKDYARSTTRTTRYWKKIGLGYKVPKAAQTGNYVDKKCPFTGSVSIRGRIMRGKVIKTHMKRTIVLRRDYLHFLSKYKRYEKRHKNIVAHVSPAFRVAVGDTVEVGECRPLSKTVRFNVLKIVKSATAESAFKKF